MANYVIQSYTDGRIDTDPVSLYPGENIDSDLVRRLEADGFRLSTTESFEATKRVFEQDGFERGKRHAHSAARAGIIEYYREIVGIPIEDLNGLLEHLGYEKYVSKWRVTLSIEGYDVLTVVVEADDEDEAERIVSDGVQQDSTEVDVDFYFSGDGEAEDAESYSYEFGNLFDFLSYEYSVEAYEE